MSRINVLDCTLRDGGYVNDWDFGENSIKMIINNLLGSGLDFIECGFISVKRKTSTSKSLFCSFEDANQRIRELVPKNDKLLFMINYGEFDQEAIPYKNDSLVSGVRVAFHKKDMHDALDLCRKVKEKGYLVFVQPMNTLNYSQDELSDLLDLSNELGPYAMYMVDSLGVMRGRDLINLYGRYEKTLNNDIYIGFHSHNNLQLSFSNAQELIECSDERKIIIDSTLMGIGRGAGNLCTELITQQLNEKNGGEYDLLPILTTLDEVLYPLQSKYQWGYTIPYYLAATCRCHPNYATYLSNKQTLRVKDMSALLKLVPDDSKSTYDQKLIDKIYVDFQSNIIDDSNAVKAICESIDDRDVIVVAPGKSYKDYLNRINQRALSECSFIISVNFIDSALNADMVFFGNNKRYSEYQDSIKHFNGKIVISSNIKDNVNADFVLNYADYLNNDPDIIDNSGLMLMNLLYNIGIKRIGLAGFDGFHLNQRMDYYDESRKVAERESIQNQNKSISIKIRQLSTKIEIDFITPSLYEKIDSDKFEI